MYWKYLGKLTKSDYYIIERKDSMLIIRRGGTFLPTPGHVRVKVQNDIIASLDVGKCTVLRSLDLSAAFDTVDHPIILLKRMRHLYGIDDTAWCWFESYLDNRHTKVRINDSFSSSRVLVCDVPQGSVLGACSCSMFIYLEISKWMMVNSLKINGDKTEFIIFGSKLATYINYYFKIGSSVIPATDGSKILGVSLDSMLNLNKHIFNTCRTVSMHLRRINSIRRYLTEEVVKTLIQSVVISRLEYCNCIFVGMPLIDWLFNGTPTRNFPVITECH